MIISKVAKGVVLVGLFALLLIPLYVSNGMFFPFITGKNFAFRIIVEIITFAWLIGLLFDPEKFRPKLSWVNVTLFFLVVIASLATIFGENPYRSFWSNYERMDGLITLLHLLPYTIVLTSSLVTSRVWQWLLHGSMGVALITSFYGMAQLAGRAVINQGGVRLDATLGNATYLAVYMLLHLFIAIYFLVKYYSSTNWAKYVYSPLILIYAYILYHTATRGAMLGTIIGLAGALLIVALKGSGRSLKVSRIGLGVIGAVIVLFLLLQGTSIVKNSPILSRYTISEITDTTKQPRLIIWKMSLKGALEKPILGWGPEAYSVVWNKHLEPSLWRQETWFDRAHNVLIDWLVTTGIFGLLLYLGLFVSGGYLLYKSSDKSIFERAILIGLLVAYLFHNIFVFDNIVSYIIFFLVLSFIHDYTKAGDSGYWTTKIDLDKMFAFAKPAVNEYKSVVSALLVVMLTFVVYFVNVKPIQANHLMLRALYNPREVRADKIEILNKLFALGTFGNMESREQLLLFLTEQRNNPNVDRNILLPLLELAQAQMEEQLKMSSTDARHHLFLGSFMNTYGRTEEALNYFNNALALSPNKQLIHFNIERALIALGRRDEALEVAKKAYELDPSYDRALIEYISASIYAGKNDLADSLMNEKFGNVLVNDPVIIQAYASNGQLGRVISIWEEQVESRPNDPNNYLSLAASYYANREDSRAIATLRDLAKLSPEAKEAADYYIEEISSGRLPRQ